jgi:hypothetical protein
VDRWVVCCASNRCCPSLGGSVLQGGGEPCPFCEQVEQCGRWVLLCCNGGSLWVNNSLVLTCVRWSLHLKWGSPGTWCVVYGGTCIIYAVGEWLCGVGWCSRSTLCDILWEQLKSHRCWCYVNSALLAYRRITNSCGTIHYLDKHCYLGARHLCALVSLLSGNCDSLWDRYNTKALTVHTAPPVHRMDMVHLHLEAQTHLDWGNTC